MDLFYGLLIGVILMWLRNIFARSKARSIAQEWDVSDPANQLKFIKSVNLKSKKPINTEAFRTVFEVAEQVVNEQSANYRIFAEVSMGSFLGTMSGRYSQNAQDRAFRSFNSKRVDFLIVDAYGKPKLVIEYQGSGHYQGNAVERDAVKKLALTKAGVPLLEIAQGATVPEVRNKVRWWLKNTSAS